MLQPIRTFATSRHLKKLSPRLADLDPEHTKPFPDTKKLSEALKPCATQMKEYGQCILKTYASVSTDACKKEFDLYMACVKENVSRP